MYIFDGGEPVKISQEIQPLWDRSTGPPGNTLWVRVDTRNKRILCGVPIGAATSPNRILVLDYRSLSDRRRNRVARLGPVLDALRKNVCGGPLAQVVPVEHRRELRDARRASRRHRASVSRQRRVSGAGNGKIYQLTDTQFSDDGAAINSYYTTYFFLSHDLEQSYQMRSHRKLFSYLTLYAEGAGNLNSPRSPTTKRIRRRCRRCRSSRPSPKDLELPINVLGERVAFQVGTNPAGAWFKLERFMPSLLPDPWAPVTGRELVAQTSVCAFRKSSPGVELLAHSARTGFSLRSLTNPQTEACATKPC